MLEIVTKTCYKCCPTEVGDKAKNVFSFQANHNFFI